MIPFQTEHRTIFLQTLKGFLLHMAVKVNVINAILAPHLSTTLSKENQEWHARMATFGINKVYMTFFVFSYSTIVDSSCLQSCLVAAVLN